MPEVPKLESLTLQQKVLAGGMLRGIGNAAIGYEIGNNGVRLHRVPRLTGQDKEALLDKFASDPKESLALARESMLSIMADTRLNDTEKKARLIRYYDAYVDLNLSLDHAIFTPTKEGEVFMGVPEYIPDGFVDMGGEWVSDPARRDREQIVVDKKAILQKYKPVLLDIFSTDYSEISLGKKKEHMVAQLAREVYRSLPYDHSKKDLGGGEVALSSLSEGVCRHQNIVFQVLCQTAGIKSQIIKTYMDGSRHATNAVRINGEWYLVDVTNPDYVTKSDGKKEWRPGAYKIGEFPGKPGSKHHVKMKHSGREHIYSIHGDMYWRITSL